MCACFKGKNRVNLKIYDIEKMQEVNRGSIF